MKMKADVQSGSLSRPGLIQRLKVSIFAALSLSGYKTNVAEIYCRNCVAVVVRQRGFVWSVWCSASLVISC